MHYQLEDTTLKTMGWKGARVWGLFLLVLCPAVLGAANPAKKIQDNADEYSSELPLQSESKVSFVAKEASEINAFRDDSSNITDKRASNGGAHPVFQIETPIVIKKIRRRPKLIKKENKPSKPLVNQNTTSEELSKQSSKQSVVSVPNDRDPSIPQESQRIENVRRNHDILRIPNSNANRNINERNFAPANFVPSENFPKNVQSQSHHESSKASGSIPIRNGEIKYVLSIEPGSSSEENSRSDASNEQFGSKRRRDPSSNFNGHQYSTVGPNNQFYSTSNSNHQNNAFPPSEAQRVTIIKEKSVHSTSSEEAQERVNIEKNPLHKESTNEVILEQHPRTFHSSQNIGGAGTHNLNNQEENVILIEGAHIPGRNYGPEDDTFGFYTDSYKDDKAPSEHPNRKLLKVIKVVKNKPDERIPVDIPLNNHGNGQSRQYFLNEQQTHHNNKAQNQHASGRHFSGDSDGVRLVNVPQQQQKGNHFIPEQVNENVKQAGHISVPENRNFDSISQKNGFPTNSGPNNKLTSQRDAPQHVILNINPDPNELYIDENTGQLIKFVISDDSSQHSNPSATGRTFNNQESSEELFPQNFEKPDRNTARKLHQKVSNQLKTHNTGNVLGGLDSNYHSAAGGLNAGHNLQEGVKYIQISDGDSFHVINNDADSSEEGQQVYYIPQENTSGNQYHNTQDTGHTNSDDDSKEYVISCDQDGQDYSAEYQSGDLGSGNHDVGGNNYHQQANFQSQNQLQSSGYESSAGLNHNKGHAFQPSNQGKSSGYDSNSGNSNFQKQKFGPRLHNQGNNQQKSIGISTVYVVRHQPNFKGTNFENSNNKGVTNFPIPQKNVGAQGHYKGSEFSNDKGAGDYSTTQINAGAQGHYKGSEFSNKGVTNFATPATVIGAQGHYKGSEFSNNKGSADYATPQINAGAQGHYKGSEFSNNGVTNFATPAAVIDAQGHYKGSEFSGNKGDLNFDTPQLNIGAQGHYKGAEFPNKGVDITTSQISAGGQGNYKGNQLSNNKGIANFNSGVQGHYKGSEFGGNKGAPAINTGTQGHYKGSEFSNNQGVTNFASQGNSGAQGHYKGSDFSNSKGAGNYAPHHINIQPQGQYKGSQNSNNKQNSKVPVYREVVTPAYPVDDFTSVKGNNKGTNFQIPQNQGSFKGGIRGIPTSNYNKGSTLSNQKGYNIGNSALSNNKGFGGNSGYNKGSQFQDQKQYIDNNAFSNSQKYGGDAHAFSGAVDSAENTKGLGLQSGNDYNSGIILSTPQKGYNSGNAFTNNQGYDIGQNEFSAIKGANKGSAVSNQKGYNTGRGITTGNSAAQGINKGLQLSPTKGYDEGNGFNNNQGYNLGGQIKGSEFSNEKGYTAGANKFPEVVTNDKHKGLSFASQKGFSDNTGFPQSKKNNFGGNSYGQGLSLNQHGPDSGNNKQKGYTTINNLFSSQNAHSNTPQLPDQKGYVLGQDIFSSNQGYDSGGQFIDSLKGDQGDLALLIQKGYNAGNDLFPSNKGSSLFSGGVSSKGFNEGLGFSRQRDYRSGNNNVLTGNKGYNSGNSGGKVQLFSDAISSKGVNAGSGISNNKGFSSGNNGYQTPVSESYSGSLSSNNRGQNHGSQKGYASGNNEFAGNQGYNTKSDSFSSNKGYQKGSNAFIDNNSNNYKGTPMKISQNNDYDKHLISQSADNNFKGTNFQQKTENSGYGSQQAVGYGDESLKSALQGQQYNAGNEQYGVSYSSSEENTHQPVGQQYSGEQGPGPVQYILVEEDIPGAKHGNQEALYYLQEDGGNDQEKTYLIVDDPTLQQHQNLRVMVDGGKDRTFPIRQLATVGLHMARTVIPQIQNSKAKSIKGKISFGVEIKKGAGQSDDSPHYSESRVDKINQKPQPVSQKQK